MSSSSLLGRAIVLAAPFLLFSTLPLRGQDVGREVVKRGTFSEDIYLAGGQVELDGEVAGDVVAAGGQITIGRRVTGDVLAAGGQLEIRGQLLDDVRVAGGRVSLLGDIADDAIAAGGQVHLDRRARVGGRAWLSGGDLEIAGHVEKELKAAGGDITLSGTVNGDVDLSGETIRITSTARIGRDLIYRSPSQAAIDPGAEISGDVTHVPTGDGVAGQLVSTLVMALGLWIAGILLLVTFPGFSGRVVARVGSAPLPSLGVGLGLVIVTPVLVLIALVTLVGIPVGLALALLYALTLLAGYLAGALFLASLGRGLVQRAPEPPSRSQRIVWLIIALAALGLTGQIPILGPLVQIAVMLLGTGGLALQIKHAYEAADGPGVVTSDGI